MNKPSKDRIAEDAFWRYLGLTLHLHKYPEQHGVKEGRQNVLKELQGYFKGNESKVKSTLDTIPVWLDYPNITWEKFKELIAEGASQ